MDNMDGQWRSQISVSGGAQLPFVPYSLFPTFCPPFIFPYPLYLPIALPFLDPYPLNPAKLQSVRERCKLPQRVQSPAAKQFLVQLR